MKKLCLFIASSLLTVAFLSPVFAQPPENLSCAKRAIINYYNSGEYDKDVTKIMQDVEKYFQKRIADNNNKGQPQKFAIVLDIDETSLNNFIGNKKRDFSGERKAVEGTYIDADAPAIKPVLDLYNMAIKNGVDVFFITFRPDHFRSYTITNLQKSGYFGWKELYMPNKDEKKMGSTVYKTNVRKTIVGQGYDIILNLGDQDSDLNGGYADYVTKLPNPLYSNNCRGNKLC